MAKFVIRNIDALELMRSLPDHCVDALITDPPYPNLSSTRGKGEKARKLDNENNRGAIGLRGCNWLLREIASESMRVVKPSGSLLVFCDCVMLPELVPMIESAGPFYRGVIVWDKEHYGFGAGFRTQHEFILHHTYGDPVFHHKGTPSVLRSKRVHLNHRVHINEKPVDLLEQMVRVVAPVGGIVLDPFCGSGAVGRACLNLGVKFIGADINQAHCDNALSLLGLPASTVA